MFAVDHGDAIERLFTICCLTFGCITAESAVSVAQSNPEQIQTTGKVAEICGAEKTSNAVEDTTLEKPTKGEFTAEQLPVIGYNKSTGLLSFNIYRDLPFVEGYQLRITEPDGLAFELSPSQADDLQSHYSSGAYKMEIEFVPSSFSDQTKPACEEKGLQHVVLATLLLARVVDRDGEQIARFETKLSRTIRLRKSQAIKAYMSQATPRVEIANITVHGIRGSSRSSNGVQGHAVFGKLSLSRPFEAQMRKMLGQSFLGCYSAALMKNQRLQGAVVLKIDLREKDVKSLLTTMKSEAVESCLKKRAQRFSKTFRKHNSSIRTIKINAVFKLIEDGSL